MNRLFKTVSIFLIVVILMSAYVFADDKKEEDEISFSQGTDNLIEAAGESLKINNNASFGEEDIRRCSEVLGKILSGNAQDLDIKEYGGMEPITIGESITLCRDGQYMYCVIDPDPGMNQLNGYELVSADSGKTWELNAFHRVRELGDMYFFEGNIFFIDGISMEQVSVPSISSDLGKTYKELDVSVFKRIMSLPAMDGYCNCYPEVRYIDTEAKQIALDWYMKNPERIEDSVYFYSMIVDYPTMKIVERTDHSGISTDAVQYQKTKYLFANSDSEKLNHPAVRARYLKEYRLAGAVRTAAEIRLAINEIYARKGYDFKEEEIRAYFDGREWYKPETGKTVTDKDLNEVEQSNINFLVGLEKEYLSAVIK